MTFLGLHLNAGRVRLGYDLVLTAFVSVFIFVASHFFLIDPANKYIFISVVLLPLFNFLMGAYGSAHLFRGNYSLRLYERFRGLYLWRPFLLSCSLFLCAAIQAIVFSERGVAVIWFAMMWAPLVLPRYFLNLNESRKFNFFKAAVQIRGPILVVGGAGFIGSMVVEELVKKGRRVRILDKLAYGKDSICDFLIHPNVELVQGDATDIVALTNAMRGVSAVVHLAGLVGDPACAVDEHFTRHTNVIATRMVKEIARSFGVPKFIFASSCSVYGLSDEAVTENSKLNPMSIYARTKIDSERELLSENSSDFNVSVLRFATVFGHSRRPRFDLVANLFTAQAYVDGCIKLAGARQWRPFIHVRDLARAIILTLDADSRLVSGQIFNVGDDKLNAMIGELAGLVMDEVLPFRRVKIVENPNFKDIRNYHVSFEKIQKVLGFHATISLKAGIREIVNRFQTESYEDYTESKFSNVDMTKDAAKSFRDPSQNFHLYRPVSDSWEREVAESA